ncbi:hypothetical protein [Natronosalvus vescus]|uniref:hypothetical protein n=1 Tax=Natronosalvus vescus TaxID=2953881 RepID=UPI0020901013|nr:hypothetical protein [Natronosalvus vescus]
MSGENPFEDLGALDADDGGEESTQTETTAATERVTHSPQQEASEESTVEPDLSGPAFEYDEVQQRPLYVRRRTWDEFEDSVGISVVPTLRKAGVRDEEKREIHDAVISLAVEEPERLVEIVLERRQSD